MIKAVFRDPQGGDRQLLLLGLSQENVERLGAGKPILFPADELGLEGWSVAIMQGETEKTILTELRAHGAQI